MKIALVIPTYKPHFIYLHQLCQNIAEQTRLPDLVIIRASSCDTPDAVRLIEDVSGFVWPFPLQILATRKQQFQAQNRNEGADAVPADFDAISFFDSDDFMHPKRLEYIEDMFLKGASAVFHGYQKGCGLPAWESYDIPCVAWDSILLQRETLVRVGSQALTLPELEEINPEYNALRLVRAEFYRPVAMDENLEEAITVTFGHCSVATPVFRSIRFNHDAVGYEDVLFASEIVKNGYKTVSVRARLSYYSLRPIPL
jgi:hypothetical protein